MVLVKHAANEPWQVDYRAGRDNVRIASLASLSITTNAQGKPLQEPLQLLIGGVSGLANRGEVTAYVRDDETGDWEKSVITQSSDVNPIALEATSVSRPIIVGEQSRQFEPRSRLSIQRSQPAR